MYKRNLVGSTTGIHKLEWGEIQEHVREIQEIKIGNKENVWIDHYKNQLKNQ
jgi:hypothetical protein